MKKKRRINRGPRKSEVELNLQVVEDLIDARIADATDSTHDAIGILIAKGLFHQEQMRCLAHTLNLFASEVENRNYNSRELMAILISNLEPIFDHVIPVHTPAEYAALTIDDIRAELSNHCGEYWDDGEGPDPYTTEDDGDEDDDEELVAVTSPHASRTRRGIQLMEDAMAAGDMNALVDAAAVVGASVAREESIAQARVNGGRRVRSVEDDVDEVEDDDILSAVSDEVDENVGSRPRRRRR